MARVNPAGIVVTAIVVVAGFALIAALLWVDYQNECDHQRQAARMRRLDAARERQRT